jgi:hypothetical protein
MNNNDIIEKFLMVGELYNLSCKDIFGLYFLCPRNATHPLINSFFNINVILLKYEYKTLFVNDIDMKNKEYITMSFYFPKNKEILLISETKEELKSFIENKDIILLK